MEAVVAILYVVVFSLIIWKSRWFRQTRLHPVLLLGAFLLKAAAAVAYILIHYRVYNGGDIAAYFNDSLLIYHTLWDAPLKYLYLTFGPNNVAIPGFVSQEIYTMGFWGDTGHYMVVRFNALVNIFTGGHMYANGIWMAFITFCSLTYLYKKIKTLVPETGSLLLAGTLFFIPSVVFWTSGLHKEGLMLTGLCLALGSWWLLLRRGFRWQAGVLLIAGAMLTYLVRDFAVLLLLPLLFIHLGIRSLPKKIQFWWLMPLLYIGIAMAGSFIAIGDTGTYMDLILQKQQQFLTLRSGGSSIEPVVFEQNFWSFVLALPKAMYHSLIAPWLTDKTSGLIWIARLETILLILTILWGVGRVLLQKRQPTLFAVMLFCYAHALMALIGFIVPNAGAIERYRSIAILLLVISLFLPARR